jgi:Uma2 family endonuclease
MLHESSLADAADRLWEELPGHPVEILQGRLVVTPPPDGSHAPASTCLVEDVFRLVVEVTSSNWSDDPGPKVECHAQAGIPVHLIADRKHDEVLVHQDPADGE